MSDLYKEALLDAKKLREVAELDAKNRIIEKVSPLISEMISNKIKSDYLKEQQSSIFIEQEDDLDLGGAELGSADAAGTPPAPVTDPAAQDGLAAPVADAPASTGTPISPTGSDLMNVSVPDANGMITVDFNDLFASGGAEAGAEPTVDAAVPQPVPADGAAAPEDLLGTTPTEPATTGTTGTGAPEEQEDSSGLDTGDLTPLQPEAKLYKNFVNQLNEVSVKIDQVYFKKTASDIVKESLKTKLFSLIENLDSLREKGIISSRQAKINENKLEFFFLKLKEAGQDNSYNITSEKNNTMKTLKEFAAELYEEETKLDFAQDTANSGKTGVPTDPQYTAHAKKQSGVSPKIGGKPSDIEAGQDLTSLSEEMLAGVAGTVDADNINDVDKSEKHWADAEARLKEEKDADCDDDEDSDDLKEGHEGFGDTTEEPAVEFEVDGKEIAEAVRNIRKENIRRKMKALKEATSSDKSWEDGEPEGGKDPSQSNLKEQAMEDEDFMGDDDSMDVVDVVDDGDDSSFDGAPEVGGDMGMDDGMGSDLVLSLDLPDELEALLADFDSDSFNVDVSVGGAGGAPMAPAVGGEEEEVILMDDEAGDMQAEMAYESRYRQAKKLATVNENKVRVAQKLLKTKEAQISELKEALEAQNLFTAKAVYLNKFLMREGLSKKAMRQIVEHLDRAKTLVEAKTIYTKIKSSLDKHVSETSGKLAGSASRVTTPGSAKLNESISRDSNNQFEVSRWQQIAGIKKKS